MLTLSGPTPIEAVKLHAFTHRDIELYVKRDDLIHPVIIGNKLRKSLLHFERCQQSGHTSVLTFGGRFSNHLLAVAQAGRTLGIATTGVVRGTDASGPSAVLDACRRLGMRIITVETQDYYPLQQLHRVELTSRLGLRPVPYLIPEGGTSALSIEGIGQITGEIADLASYAYIICAVGTGGTAAGLAWSLAQRSGQRLPTILAIAVVAGYTTLPDQGRAALRDKAGSVSAEQILSAHLEFDGSAPWGRYGQPAESIMQRLCVLQDAVSFPLDYVYTGKAMLQLEQMALSGRFARGSRLLFLHTGGYQTAPIK